MRLHNGNIDYIFCLKHNITVEHGALFDLLTQLPLWADSKIIDKQIFWFIGREKIIAQLPIVYKTINTVYRHLSVLHNRKLINYLPKDKNKRKMDLVNFTALGKEWNRSKIIHTPTQNPITPSQPQANPHQEDAEEIYEFYKKNVKASKQKKQSLNNLNAHLKKFKKLDLIDSIKNYLLQKNRDEKFGNSYKECSNFFGVSGENKGFFEDFLNQNFDHEKNKESIFANAEVGR